VRTNFRPVFVVQEEIFSQLLGLRISVVTAIPPSLFRREKVYGHSPDVSKRLLCARNWRTNPETQLTHALGYGKTQRFKIRLKRGSHLRQNQARKSAPALRFTWIAALRRILTFSPKRALFPQPKIRKQQDLCLSIHIQSQVFWVSFGIGAGPGERAPAAARKFDLPFPVSPPGKAGAGGFPPRWKHAARQQTALAHTDAASSPHKRAAAPLCIPRPAALSLSGGFRW
jgi:hypothetical protein